MLGTGSLERIKTATENIGVEQILLPDNVNLHIHFGAHSSADDVDMATFQPLFDQADIFIPESVGWSAPLQREVNRVAKGDYRIYQKLNSFTTTTHETQILRTIFNSQVLIRFVDIEADDPFLSKLDDAHIFSEVDALSKVGMMDPSNPEKAAAELLEHAEKISVAEAYRERTILSNIGSVVTNTVGESPKFRTKQNINVLMKLGTGHTPMYAGLKHMVNNPSHVHRSFSAQFVWGPLQQLYQYGRVSRAFTDEQRRTSALRHLTAITAETVALMEGDTWSGLTHEQKILAELAIVRSMTDDEMIHAIQNSCNRDDEASYQDFKQKIVGISKNPLLYPLHNRGQ